MSQNSTNLTLLLEQVPEDDSVLTGNYINAQSGYASTSNMQKIDAFAGETRNAITDLKGSGYTNQTVKGNFDLIQATNQRITYTTVTTGINTLVGTISELSSIQNNINIKIIPTASNTGAVTVNINGTGALPLTKVQNWTGSTIYSALEADDLTPNQPVIITKSNDGLRYIYLGLENTASHIYYKNATNDYTNLQTKLADMVTLTGSQVLTNKTLTTPKISSGSAIVDVNGNELVKFPTTVASAVNEVTIANSITGTNPSISATGNDTNISLNLLSKGTGTVKANSLDVVVNNPVTTVINSGFASGWSGNIIITKNYNNLCQMFFLMAKNVDIAVNEAVVTIPVGLRPANFLSTTVSRTNASNIPIANSFTEMLFSTNGIIDVSVSGTSTGGQYISFQIMYYSA